jgi:hypothetical protein
MSGPKIFLSYRRDDSSGYTELLYTRLSKHFGPKVVFRDVHVIRPMEPYQKVIDEALCDSAVLVVVISRLWLDIRDAMGGRRIDQPDDVLCGEVASALSRAVPILPVLVGGARMPTQSDLPENLKPLAAIHAFDLSDARLEYDFERLVAVINEKAGVKPEPAADINLFSCRGRIERDDQFFNRTAEIRMLRDYMSGRQNCQIVGPKSIGKSSLMRFVHRHCAEWLPNARVAYLDLQDARCYTQKGWLRRVGEGLKLAESPQDLSDLMEQIEDLIDAGIHPVLCLDEFSQMTDRPVEFPPEVYLTLRAAGQRGMSILTAAKRRLSELTNPRDATSPFFNTFPLLTLGAFTAEAAQGFVALDRPGVPDFTERERDRILEFAAGQPMALQAACYHVLSVRQTGEDMTVALGRAAADCGR